MKTSFTIANREMTLGCQNTTAGCGGHISVLLLIFTIFKIKLVIYRNRYLLSINYALWNTRQKHVNCKAKETVTRRVSVRFWECVVVGGGGGGGWWGGSVCVWGYPGVKGGLLYRNC